MKINDNGCLKSQKISKLWFKKALKSIAVGAISLGVVAGAIFGFAGCSSQTTTPNPPHVEDPPIIVQPQPDLTFDNFLADYKDQAVQFVNNYIKDDVYENKNVLSEEVSIAANEDNNLDKVSLAYTYKLDDTARAFNIATVTLDPIDLDEIANDTITRDDVNMTIEQKTIMTFDAKENYQNKDLGNKIGNSLKNFLGVEFSNDTFEGYAVDYSTNDYQLSVLDINNNSASIHKLGLYKSSEESSTEDLINRLGNPVNYKTYDVEEYEFEGTNIDSLQYQHEIFNNGQENPPDEKVESIDQLFKEYSSEVNAGLEAGYENIIQKVIPNNILGFDASQLKDSNWNFDCNSEGEISKINFVTTYHRERNMQTLIISSISLQNPININNLDKKDISSKFNEAAQKGSYKYEYNFSYDTTIQAENQKLADAIFSAEGKNVDGSQKFIVKSGSLTDSTLGEVTEYRVMQKSQNGIEQITLIIKDASSNEGVIKNVLNKQYKITSTKSYKLGSYYIAQENALNALDYDDYNL